MTERREPTEQRAQMELTERKRELAWLRSLKEERPPYCRRHIHVLDRRGICPVSGVEPLKEG